MPGSPSNASNLFGIPTLKHGATMANEERRPQKTPRRVRGTARPGADTPKEYAEFDRSEGGTPVPPPLASRPVDPMNVTNWCQVGMSGTDMVVVSGTVYLLTPSEAINLAAWLVALTNADPVQFARL